MMKSKIKILFLGLISCLCISCTSVYLRVPNAPFFADPNYNGSTDPEIIYNPVTKEFLVYYTSRRPLSGNSFVSTPIGVISSKIYWIGHLRDIVPSMEMVGTRILL